MNAFDNTPVAKPTSQNFPLCGHYNFSAWAWFMRTDAKTIAECMEDETREEFVICYQALLAMAEG